jgi:hypothetical protein
MVIMAVRNKGETKEESCLKATLWPIITSIRRTAIIIIAQK